MENAFKKVISYGLIICVISVFIPDVVFSQAKSKVKKTIRGEALIPRPISNKAFRQLFSGVFAANLSMNFGVKNFNTGIIYSMMQCQIFPRVQSDPHSIFTVHTGGIRFSYDVYPSKETMQETLGNFFVFSPFIQGGISQVDYSRLKCKTPQDIIGKSTQTFSVTGGANFNLMFSEYDGVGFTLGYSFFNHEFNPDNLCLSQYYPNFKDSDKKGLTQFILFGLNVHFDLANRDKE